MRGGRDEHDNECSLGFDSRKTTWMGVMPRQAAALTGASTGPFGYILISLSEGRVCERGGGDEGWRGNMKEREDVWKTTICFNNYTMLRMIL